MVRVRHNDMDVPGREHQVMARHLDMTRQHRPDAEAAIGARALGRAIADFVHADGGIGMPEFDERIGHRRSLAVRQLSSDAEATQGLGRSHQVVTVGIR